MLAHLFPARRGNREGAAEEAAASRLWGGIHFRSDNEEGLRLGRSVGRDILRSLALESDGRRKAGRAARQSLTQRLHGCNEVVMAARARSRKRDRGLGREDFL